MSDLRDASRPRYVRRQYFQPDRIAALFENPTNGWRESVPNLAWLWMLLFGIFYMAARSLWIPLGITLGALFVLSLVSWLLLIIAVPAIWIGTAAQAQNMIRSNYMRRGWIEIDPYNQDEQAF